MKIRVLLADDHQVVREGLRLLLESANDIEIIGEAADGRQAVEMVRRLTPDVVVLDIVMPHLTGLEALRQIRRECPTVKALMLTSYESEDFRTQSMEGGASAYVAKHSGAAILLAAIRQAAQGKSASDRSASDTAADQRPNGSLKDSVAQKNPARLTRRQAEVLQLVAEGYANKQMAAELGISTKTVEKHRQQMMNKLHIHEIAGLTRYAVQRHLVNSSLLIELESHPAAN
jgi:DNA-binding NarL/FixJ family response regulator